MSTSRTLLLASLVASLVFVFTGMSTAEAQDRTRPQSIGLMSVEEVSASVLETARTSVNGPDGVGNDGPLSTVGLELAVLYHQHQATGSAGVRRMREADRLRPKATDERSREGRASRIISPLSADGERVVVEAVAVDDPARLLHDLQALGLRQGTTAGSVVGGRLPIGQIKEAAALSSLLEMMPSYARSHVGDAESEADSAHWARQARNNLGVEGSGQKVCALSDSYNQSTSTSTTASDDVQSGDLPGPGNPAGRTRAVDVVKDSDTQESDEGRAMLQLIHDIAPGARLGFHTALGGLTAFSTGIRNLADADCTVIVDDIRYNTEPFYQDGPVSNAVNDVVAQGIPYVSSAGNDGQNSYEAPFREAPGEPGVLNSTNVPHDFDSGSGVDTRQEITIRPGGTFQIFSFQWTDPSAQTGGDGPETNIDIGLVDADGNVVDAPRRSNAAVPVESVEYTNEGSSDVTLDLVVEKEATDPTPDEIKYVYSGSDFTIEEYDTGGPTIYGHPMAEGAMAVAAAPFFSTAAYRSDIDSSAYLESFSAKGGIPILFDQSGSRLDSPVMRQKPEVTGTDAVDNTFFGEDIPDSAIDGIDPDSDPNFYGTSAAAPNIAAIAALIRQAAPGLTPTQVYGRLEDAAVDVRVRRKIENDELVLEQIAAGVDPWSGHGFVRADRAVPPPAGVQIADKSVSISSAKDGVVEVAWTKVGTEDVDAFLLEKKFFDGGFVEQERIDAGSTTEFARTIEDLPIGQHTFRISALKGDSTLATATVTSVLRRKEANASVYPNPFGAQPNLSVTLPEIPGEEQRVTVRVFDILGRHVATPVEDGVVEGSGSTSFNLGSVRSLASGVYFFRVRGDNFVATTKAVRVR